MPFGNGLAVDVGTGSGIQARTLLRNGWKVVAADIEKDALISVDGIRLKVVANLLSCFRDRSFSLIVFNPPYLKPSSIDYRDSHWLEAGEEFFHTFFSQASRVLASGGRIIMVYSSIGHDIGRIGREHGFSERIVDRMHIFFEDIILSEFSMGKRFNR